MDELNERYGGMDIVLKDVKFQVYKIEEVKNGVHIAIKNSKNENISNLTRDGETIVFELEECKKLLLGLRE